MGGAMFPPCCLTWGQTMVEVMKIMTTSFKWYHEFTATLSIPNSLAGHPWPTPLLETPGHSQAILGQSLVGSLLLSPGSWCAQGFACALQESVFPVLCKFWQLYGGLMVTSSKRAYAIPRSTSPRAPAPEAVLCWPVPLQETLKHSSGSVSVGSGSWRTQVLFEPSAYLQPVWDLIWNMILPFLPSCWGLSFALEHGILLFCGIQQSPVNGCSAVSCNFGVLSEDELTSSLTSSPENCGLMNRGDFDVCSGLQRPLIGLMHIFTGGLLWVLLTSVEDFVHKEVCSWFNGGKWSVFPELALIMSDMEQVKDDKEIFNSPGWLISWLLSISRFISPFWKKGVLTW